MAANANTATSSVCEFGRKQRKQIASIFNSRYSGRPCYAISAVTGTGVRLSDSNRKTARVVARASKIGCEIEMAVRAANIVCSG